MYYTVKFGKRVRRSYAKIPTIMQLPDLIEIQKSSYKDFLHKDVKPEERKNIGLLAAFLDIFPISDFSDTLTLEFVSYSLGEPKYDVLECQERGMNYAVPLKVKLNLIIQEKDKETGARRVGEGREQDVYMGELPLMTETGTFIINGAERVIVSQLQRSPGVLYDDSVHTSGKRLFSARIIPYRGAWIEFEYDNHDVIYVRLDHRKKMPATLLLRALGWVTDEEIMRLFSKVECVKVPSPAQSGKREVRTLRKGEFDEGIGRMLLRSDVKNAKSGKVIARSGDILTEAIVKKLEKKVRGSVGVEQISVVVRASELPGFPHHLVGRITASPVVDTDTGEVLVTSNEELTPELLERILQAGAFKPRELELLDENDAEYAKAIRNTLAKDPIETQDDAMVEIFRRLLSPSAADPPTIDTARTKVENYFFNPKRYDLASVFVYGLIKSLV